MPRKNLYLLDGNSMCYRAFYAIRNMSTSKGQPTNVVFGFIQILTKLIKEQKPDMIAVAFDLKGPTFRHKKFDEYKIHRKPMPDDLVSQMPIVKEVVKAYRIPIYEMQGFEADDVLATVAERAVREGVDDVFIVTGDKDALQLISDRIKVFSTNQEGLIYDAAKVRERFNVAPEHVVDIMGLMGDATDNIPGVKGIGEKTAVELISEFGTLDDLYRNIDKVKSEARQKMLKESEKMAFLSRELAVLDREVPLDVDFDALVLKEPDNARLAELFKELEFKALFKEFAPQDSLDSRYHIIKDEEGLEKLAADLERSGEFVFDFETTSTEPTRAEPAGISFSYKKGEVWYAGIATTGGLEDPRKFDPKRFFARFKKIFEDPSIRKIGQNIKYEYIILARKGVSLKGELFDTMIASYLLNPSKRNHGLDDISLEYLGHRMTTPITDLIGKGKTATTMDKVALDRVAAYCAEDSDVTFRVKAVLEKELGEKKLFDLFRDVEMPLVEVLAKMELDGVAIDVPYLAKLSKEMEKKLGVLTKKIYELAGSEFNINSPKQLSEVLFVKLKLPVIRKTKTGFSTDEDVLTKLASKHPLPETLLEYREYSKLKSTYVDALPELIDPATGRLHTSFNQTVTATGRLSSSDPNIQNIPIRTEEGRKIRKAFVPYGKSDRILSADYSQIELRLLAHLSGDRALIKAFSEGLDIHRYTASLVFGIGENDVSDEMRSMAKTVNFGIIYGMSPYGLSQALSIEVDKAKEFIDAYFARYADVKKYLSSVIEEAKTAGFVTTILGRRRYIPEINSPDKNIREFAERTAINAPVQGSAADIIKVAMRSIHDELGKKRFSSRMTLQVHDELVFNVTDGEMDDLSKLVRNRMEKIIELKVPIEAHIEAGKNWLELERI